MPIGSRQPELLKPLPPHGRRTFVKNLVALAGSAALLGYDIRRAAAEPPPETTRIRLAMIKTDPQKLIAQGTDWRFVNQLKKELKA